ncbi:MAG: 16S rRNA (guanine(527)-N(7))-methyltransferase RsmG [Actinomycetota bacterium]|nr:16S rRNA (guanine(527)-N(7))-methyltransferase RsmG [Actinomycetota bacterium]
MPDGPLAASGLARLQRQFGLELTQTRQLRDLVRLLAEEEHAPTTVREPARVLDEHIADALSALALPALRKAAMIVDVGSGAGLPGLPLAIALRDARVTLLEATGRKCAFLCALTKRLELANVQVVHCRAESWSAGAGLADVVTARAVAPLDVVVEYAAPLLRLGGVLVAWRGQRDASAEADAGRAADLLGMTAEIPIAVEPYPGSVHRHLHVFLKVAPTPPRFPRREGVARKRPLGRLRGAQPAVHDRDAFPRS